jgi:myo-inositol-1(or 4)-monophosphatase
MWFIDPIDGTMNFAHGLPIFSVSLAYEFDGELTHGVVYNPIHEEMYSATLGEGAFLNGLAIHVAETEELKDSLLVTGFPYDSWTNPDNNLAEHQKFTLLTQGVRRLGSAALDLCYVAAGRLDGFWEKRLNAWDVAAGALIVQDAGGKVSAIDGNPDFMKAPQSILAANIILHEKMLAVLKE